MKSFAFEKFDSGQVLIQAEFVPLLQQHGLTTFDSWMNYQGGQAAKHLLRERRTTRIQLVAADNTQQVFYLKRHFPSSWREYVKPLLHGRWPLLGARNEWNALLHFHAAGVPTMTPVALGQSGRLSFLVTAGLEDCRKLSAWMSELPAEPDARDPRQVRRMIVDVAHLTRHMHRSGLHHQDYYLGHLLQPLHSPNSDIHVIDLGRAQLRRPLSSRWIIKDLGQLLYSANRLTLRDALRFLRHYLGRRLTHTDRPFLRRIALKHSHISRHTKKHAL